MKSNKSNWFRSSVLAAAMSVATLSAPMVAYADVAEAHHASENSPTRSSEPSELEVLTQRQSKAEALGQFAGGDPVIIIGGSTLLLVLIVVLIVLLIMD